MKDCENCGTLFKPMKKTSRFCTRQCFIASTRVHKRGNCEQCGIYHDGTYASGRFCSSFCSRSFSATKTDEVKNKISNTLRKLDDIECPKCKRVFRPKYTKAKFCSIECGRHSGPIKERPIPDINQTIQCNVCKKYKKLEEFANKPENVSRFGKQCKCNECGAIYSLKRRMAGDNFINNLLNSCKYLAHKKSKTRPGCGQFDLTREDIEEMREEQNNKCKLSGVQLTWTQRKDNYNKASIDRIDNNKGYTRDNVRLVTWAVNHARYTWTDKQFKEMCLNVIKTSIN